MVRLAMLRQQVIGYSPQPGPRSLPQVCGQGRQEGPFLVPDRAVPCRVALVVKGAGRQEGSATGALGRSSCCRGQAPKNGRKGFQSGSRRQNWVQEKAE